jgi:hypothetical protein
MRLRSAGREQTRLRFFFRHQRAVQLFVIGFRHCLARFKYISFRRGERIVARRNCHLNSSALPPVFPRFSPRLRASAVSFSDHLITRSASPPCSAQSPRSTAGIPASYAPSTQ